MSDFLLPEIERIQQFKVHMTVRGDVLEIGTGSGIIAKHVYELRTGKVVAVDINPAAVQHAKKLVPHADIFTSDLFENVTGKFDTIIFAAPWSEGVIKKPLDYALYDCGVVEKFFMEAKDYLSDDGSIWLQYCDAFPNNFSRLDSWIKKGGFSTIDSWHYKRWGALVHRQVKVILYKIENQA